MRPLRVSRFPGWCVPSTSGRRLLYSVSLQVSRIEVARRIEMSDITCQVWRCGCTRVSGVAVSCLSAVEVAS